MSIIFYFTFTSALRQFKTDYFHSQPNLSTLFFDDHGKISIGINSKTYFFINSPTPKYISYSFILNKGFGKNKIIKKKIYNENEFIHINNTKYLRAYFNFNKKAINGDRKFVAISKLSSISFLSYEFNDLCQNGVEFIQSEKELQLKDGEKKCFYLPPQNNKGAVLYTDENIYSSSLSLETLSDQNKVFDNALSRKKLKISHSKLLSSQDSQNIKNSKLLIEPTNNNYPCQYRKKHLPLRKSFLFNININVMLLIIVISGIFLISLCVKKQSVDASDNNDNYQNQNNNTNYYNNQPNNGYNIPPPVSTPLLPYNQIHSNPTVNPMQQMSQLYSTTNQTNPTNSMNMNIYPPNNDGGMNCAYHNNVQSNTILPPANPPLYNGTPNAYPGVVQYPGAIPMPNAAQSSMNTMNQVLNYYQAA